MSRLFRNALLIIFIIALMIIVFLQYSSDYNIRQLILGNENLLQALQIKSNLQKLQTEIVSLESKVRGAIIRGQNIDTNHLKEELNTIQWTISDLDSLDTDSLTDNLVTELKNNVRHRIIFNTALLDTFRTVGKYAAESMANSHPGRLLADSLKSLVSRIDSIHELSVTTLIKAADKNTNKAKALSSILAILATIACLFTFAYISYKVKEQQLLINKLNESERKILDVMRIKEKFLANMSHEIRTPLNSIIGFSELLDKQDLSVQSREFVNHIKKSGQGLLNTVNDILDLSKIEAGMMRIENVPFRLNEVIEYVDSIFRKKFADKGVKWHTHIDPSIPGILVGDAMRLNQILTNLLSNAFKFTESGEVNLEVALISDKKDEVLLLVEIKDTGIGIANENLASIFERFRQADDAITRKYGGTGLGLSIVKELVELQNGNIEIISTAGLGSSFKIILPYQKHYQELTDVPAIAGDSTENQVSGPVSILIVEDNETNQILLKHFLSDRHIHFQLVSNGAEAIQKLKTAAYDLILMDIQMPEMDGYTATNKIRNQLMLDVPIIAMTAYAEENEKAKCLQAGMNEYLSKPIRLDHLYQLIIRYTQRREPDAHYAATEHLQPAGKNRMDWSYLDEISPGNIEFKQTILRQFLTQVEHEIPNLEQYYESGDITLFKRTAHRLKSTFSIVGLNHDAIEVLDGLENCNTLDRETASKLKLLKKLSATVIEEANLFLTPGI